MLHDLGESLALDLDLLLAPVSEAQPTGPDLADSEDRMDIERAFATTGSGEGGGSAPDWLDILNKIAAQSEKTKDIWLAAYLMRAGAGSGKLEVVATGAEYLAGLVEKYWDHLHPLPTDEDFSGRANACEALRRNPEFLAPLRRMTLISGGLGKYTGLDIERFAAKGNAEDSYVKFGMAMEEAGKKRISGLIELLDRIRDGIRRADMVLKDKAGWSSDGFKLAYETLAKLRAGLVPYGEPEAKEAGGDEQPAGSGEVPEPGPGGARISGRVESRADVVTAIDAIVAYYQRSEPNSPMPMIMTRARAWVSMDFLAILQDIAPNSLSEVRTVLSAREAEK